MKRLFSLLIMLLVGAVAFSSFECASRNITTAKVKMKQQLFDEAKESLNKELALNPNSEEALALMADLHFQQRNFPEAAKYALKCIEVAKNPQIIDQQQKLINNVWIESYNNGIANYNSYLSSKKPAVLDSAMSNFKLGAELRPQILEFYNFIGIIHELKNDQKSAMASYEEYIRKFDKNYQFGLKNGFYVRVPRAKVIDKLGNPKTPMPGLNSKGDTTYTDFYQIDGKELYVFSEYLDGKLLVTGWNYDLPSNWMASEKKMRVDINTGPIATLAQIHYNNKDYEKSLEYIKMLTSLEPDNSSAYASMVNIYQELNRTDEAVKTVESLIKADPKNPLYITQLADLYQSLGKYDEAINTYMQAIEINPEYDRAIRNLAAAHKNRASLKQKTETDKQDKDKAYKIDMEKYMPDLRASAKYFAKALTFKTFRNDILVLTELANIYQVLEETDNLKKIVRTLEANEFDVPKDKLQQYYLNMLKIYSEMKDDKKTSEISKKLEAMK